MHNLTHALIYARYFAPRGRERLLALGEHLGARHLSYDDKLVGIVGAAGSGKSLIIKGMFPGLCLANDDDNIDTHTIMQMHHSLDDHFGRSTYHLDIAFQMAFTQMFEIVEFVKGALAHKRRVIIEHFDLLYPFLQVNADILVGIGEEVIVARPNIFGPLPKDIHRIVFHSVQKRKMAHTAEDLTTLVLKDHLNIHYHLYNSDVRGGFVLGFHDNPNLDIEDLERRVQALIDASLDVSYYDENHIRIGDDVLMECTGPRIHVRNTDQVENFSLLRQLRFDPRRGVHCLVGMVGNPDFDQEDLNRIAGDEI